jgi:hypothetical protein
VVPLAGLDTQTTRCGMIKFINFWPPTGQKLKKIMTYLKKILPEEVACCNPIVHALAELWMP